MRRIFLPLALLAGSAFAQAPPLVDVPPIGTLCLPSIANFHTLVNPSTGNTVVTLWCDNPTGTYHYAVSGSSANWAQEVCLTTIEPFNVSTSWMQHAWGACVTTLISASDLAYAQRLWAQWVPRPTINGTGPQPIYTLNASGGFGPALKLGSPAVAQTIAGGRVVGGLRATGGVFSFVRYCDVRGMLSDQNMILPPQAYAGCTLVLPATGGFPFQTSADKASITAYTEAFIVDGGHHVWGIDSKLIITVDGIEDSTSANVIQLAYVGGLIWQRNGNQLWWSKTTPTAPWLPAGGTTTAPL